MTYQTLKFFQWLAQRLSPAGRQRLGNVLGAIAWRAVSKKRKQIAIGNIRATLGAGDAAEKIAAHSVTRFGRILVDMFNYCRLSKDNIGEIMTINGRENLENALALGKGAVLASGHCGNWELLGTGLTFGGYPIVGLARKQVQNNGFEQFLSEFRTIGGGKIVYSDDVRGMVRTLKNNNILYILYDQDVLPNGVWVDFLGRQTSAPPGAAVLARMADSPIVPAFITEVSPGHYEVNFYPPITASKAADKAAQVQETMQELYRTLERHIRRYPHEWLWIHDRWRVVGGNTPPAGNPSTSK
jgi:Lauroyl/myristoyl acyltransferase